jgi:hypothetical protein
MKTLGIRRDPFKAPKGMEKVYAIVLAQQKREMLRLEPQIELECTRAENQLGSAVAAERKSAAKTLGKLRYLSSFQPLLHALARESGPGDGGRAMKAAMLKALRNIGSDHCGHTALEIGRGPLREFAMAHLADHLLVGSALNALAWTCLRCESLEDMSRVMEAADAAGYRKTSIAASRVWLDTMGD